MKNEEVVKAFVNGAIEGSNSTKSLRIVKGVRDIVEVKRTFLYSYNTPIGYRVWNVTTDKFFIVNKKFSKTTSRHQNLLKKEIQKYSIDYDDVIICNLKDAMDYGLFQFILESQHLNTGLLYL